MFVKEVMIMKYLEKLDEIMKKQHGTILSSDLDKYEIPRAYLQIMVAKGIIERTGRGIYVSVNSVEDEMYAMQTKYSKLIYSHETALFLHGLSDRTPFEYTASVPSGYKAVTSVADRFKIYYIKKELHNIGVITATNSFGNPIRLYNIERTICDIMRSKNRIDIQIFNEALKRFVKLKSVDYSLLMDYAKKLRVESAIRKYLEVLF